MWRRRSAKSWVCSADGAQKPARRSGESGNSRNGCGNTESSAAGPGKRKLNNGRRRQIERLSKRKDVVVQLCVWRPVHPGKRQDPIEDGGQGSREDAAAGVGG